MGELIMKFLKLFILKDVTEAAEADKDKPMILKKRVVGAGLLTANGLLAYILGYKIDEALVLELIKNLNNLQDVIYQIVDVLKAGWPAITGAYFALMMVVGWVQKKIREAKAAR